MLFVTSEKNRELNCQFKGKFFPCSITMEMIEKEIPTAVPDWGDFHKLTAQGILRIVNHDVANAKKIMKYYDDNKKRIVALTRKAKRKYPEHWDVIIDYCKNFIDTAKASFKDEKEVKEVK